MERSELTKPVWLPDIVKDFESIARCVEYPPKTILFFKGDPADKVYFLEEGVVSVFHYTQEGETISFLHHQRGNIVGVGGVLNDTKREVCCETVGRCKVWVIDKEDFIDMLYDYPILAVRLATELSSRMKSIDTAVFRAVSLSAEQKIAASLLDLVPRDIADKEQPARVYITHQELSNMSGACRQTVTTILGRMKKQEILSTGKGYIDVYDLESLHEIMNVED